MAALIAERGETERARIGQVPRALSAELAAARRELRDMREQVGLLREKNARLWISSARTPRRGPRVSRSRCHQTLNPTPRKATPIVADWGDAVFQAVHEQPV